MPMSRYASNKTIAVVYLVVVPIAILTVAVLGYVQHRETNIRTGRLAQQGKEAHDAICALRADFEQRVKTGRQYLREHPDGFAGIDAATIRNSLKNQQATVDALSAIVCPRPKGTP